MKSLPVKVHLSSRAPCPALPSPSLPSTQCTLCVRLFLFVRKHQLYALGNVLSRRFHMCSTEVKNTLFRSFCTPMYTCQLWWNFSVQSMHKLNVAYNNAFRFMHHLPTYCSASLMFVVNRVPNCRAVIRNRIYGFMKRLVSSSNALVLSADTSDTRFHSRIVRHWLKSLYIHFDGG